MKNQELPRRALDLSLAIYRITAKFPAGEMLAGQMRELGNQIAGDLAGENFVDIKNKINRLKIYFAIAKAQNWVKAVNWSFLNFEYYKLQQAVLFESAIGGESNHVLAERQAPVDKSEEQKNNNIMSHNIEAPKKPASPRPVALSGHGSNERQIKIMEVLDKNTVLKMVDLIPLFKNDVSDRTLRNELKRLIKKGLVKKRGVNKFAEYYRK